MEKKLNKNLVYIIGLSTTLLIIVIAAYYGVYSQNKLKEKEDYTYVSKLFDEQIEPVVNDNQYMIRPYNNENVKVVQNFYDYKGKEKDQENSIINYDTTYLQNNGVAYGGINETFDVLATLDGTVTSIKDDNLLGKVVTITHNNGITTVYQSLSEVTVKENDQVVQGTVIGKAGENNINKDLGNHVSFEVMKDGTYLNPENCYETSIDKLTTN